MRYALILLIAALPLSGCASDFVAAPGYSTLTAQKPAKHLRKGKATSVAGGWVRARSGVRMAELSKGLRSQLADIGKHFGKPVHVVSGCRSPLHNRRVGGVNKSFHIRCLAADFFIPGVSKQRLANHVRALPNRGGMGVYCGKSTVHLDLGPRRAWYKACGKRRAPARRKINRHIASVPASALPKLPKRLSLGGNPSAGTATTSLGIGIQALLATH